MHAIVLSRLVALAALFLLAAGGVVQAQVIHGKRETLLSVPYVRQSPDACGAAAAAMVLRYWGVRDATADELDRDVACTDRGLPPEAFVSALRARGWQTDVSTGAQEKSSTAARLHDALDRGNPAVVLLAGDRDANRYVVVVAATPDEVLVHDPNQAPYRALPMKDFDHEWETSGRWMLVARPAERDTPPARASTDAADPAAESKTPCAELIGAAVGESPHDRPEAERALAAATRLCPDDPAAWGELADLRMRDSRWSAAEHYARRAADLAPEDAGSWNRLGAARYLAGDVRGALRAWNRINQPVVSAVEVNGARTTSTKVVADLIGLEPGELLTTDRFIRASHRLDQLPVSFDSRLKYSPEQDNSAARVEVYLDERDVVPAGAIPIALIGVGGVVFQDVEFEVAGPTGHGEDFTASWGWERNWRHLSLGVEAPAPGPLPGIVSVKAFWESQVFAPAPDVRATGEQRSVDVSFSNWGKSWLWWSAGTGVDRFGTQMYGMVKGAIETRVFRDHVSFNLEGSQWRASAATPSFGTATVWMSTRSTTRVDMPSWLTTFGTSVASSASPYQLWTGAGSSEDSIAFLRAHPLIRRGVLDGEVFGRRLEFGSVEYDRPLFQSGAGPVSWAAFVDAAQAFERAGVQPPTPLLVDVGGGFRLRPPAVAGVLRVDLARGVRDGVWRGSIGMMERWPRH